MAPAPLNNQLWDRLAALRPSDLNVQLTRFDLALSAGDEDKITNALRAIRKVNGETDSTARLCQAIYLIWRAQHKKDTAGLDEAAALLTNLERERNEWARVAYAQALIHDLRGHHDSALAKYRQAFKYGETSPDAIRRLLELLRGNNNLDEIASVLQKVALPENVTSQRIAAEAALHAGDMARAIELADRAVLANSTNPADYIWQGQIYFGAGSHHKAEAALRKATALRPESPDGWLPLIQYFVLTKGAGEAEKTLDEAQGKVAPPERSLFLGSAYALLGKEDKAREAYARARAERSEHPGTVRAEAVFLYQHPKLDLDRKNADAIEAFRRLLTLPAASADDRDYARQMIAICFASSPDYAVSRQALSELGLLQGDQLRPLTGTESPAEIRTRVLALAFQRDRESRLAAIDLIEKSGSVPTSDDQFLLAQLYRSVGKDRKVREVMSNLLVKNNRVTRYIQFYAGWLLQIGDHRAAEEWVNRLAELQPESLVTAELRARLAVARGNSNAARSIIVPRASGPDAPVLVIARVCESLKLYEDAEQLFQRVVEKTKEKQPDAPLLLAAFYGRRGQTAAALRICDEVRKKAPILMVAKVAVEALYDNSAPSRADTEHVAAWLSDAITGASGTTKAILVQLLASVRNLQGDYASAMKLYADAISVNDRDALALNNLAFLVSAKDGDHRRALDLIERAKKARGPIMDILDTEALIRIEKGDFEPAQKLLDVVAAEAPSGTAFYHLARVELALGHKVEAKSAWQRAQDLGIKLADLHPLERPEFARVSALLK
ncbi:tetratricopeptide repeat protein [Gemmata massiliana]|nr:tetratricopeptide repeat protein [Gemmata massiliana]